MTSVADQVRALESERDTLSDQITKAIRRRAEVSAQLRAIQKVLGGEVDPIDTEVPGFPPIVGVGGVPVTYLGVEVSGACIDCGNQASMPAADFDKSGQLLRCARCLGVVTDVGQDAICQAAKPKPIERPNADARAKVQRRTTPQERHTAILAALRTSRSAMVAGQIQAAEPLLAHYSKWTIYQDLKVLEAKKLIQMTTNGWVAVSLVNDKGLSSAVAAVANQVAHPAAKPAAKQEDQFEVVWSGQKTDPPLTSGEGFTGSSLATEGAIVNRSASRPLRLSAQINQAGLLRKSGRLR